MQVIRHDHIRNYISIMFVLECIKPIICYVITIGNIKQGYPFSTSKRDKVGGECIAVFKLYGHGIKLLNFKGRQSDGDSSFICRGFAGGSFIVEFTKAKTPPGQIVIINQQQIGLTEVFYLK